MSLSGFQCKHTAGKSLQVPEPRCARNMTKIICSNLFFLCYPKEASKQMQELRLGNQFYNLTVPQDCCQGKAIV